MNDDLLSRAARALREETAGDDASARFTRSRIMASVHEDRVKRRTRWAFLIPIAATFVAASAFGAVTGRASHALDVVARALGIHRSVVAPPPAVSRRAEVPKLAAPAVTTAPPPVSPSPPEPAEAVKETLAVPAEPVALPKAAAVSVTPRATEPPAVPSAALDPTFDLYRVAHRAHFVDRDWAGALAKWDAYLRAAPGGALVPEARYNRALCLLRLRRNAEARAALQPFAQGRYGTYRRDDAAKLLEALPAEPHGP